MSWREIVALILSWAWGRLADKRTAAGRGAGIRSGGKVISVKRLTCQCFCSWPLEHMFVPPPRLPLLSGWNLTPSPPNAGTKHTYTVRQTDTHTPVVLLYHSCLGYRDESSAKGVVLPFSMVEHLSAAVLRNQDKRWQKRRNEQMC